MKVYFAYSLDHARAQSAPKLEQTLATCSGLAKLLSAIKSNGISVVDPAATRIPKSDPSGRFNYCLSSIDACDVVVVDATGRLGVGVGAEMMYARTRNIDVFVVCPEYSYYRTRGNTMYLHPFIQCLSSRIFVSFDDCAGALDSMNDDGGAYA